MRGKAFLLLILAVFVFAAFSLPFLQLEIQVFLFILFGVMIVTVLINSAS